MTTSPAGVDAIKVYEGFSSSAYKDIAGVWTIGHGHTDGVKEGDICTPEQATLLLQRDLRGAEAGVKGAVKVPLTQGQFDALVSFTFNLGSGNLRTSTLLKRLNVGDYNEAALEFPKWIYAGGKQSQGLLNRRLLEQKMFLGEDPE